MTCVCFSFFFNDTPPTEIYTLSLHDALPISGCYLEACAIGRSPIDWRLEAWHWCSFWQAWGCVRSEEHTSELQSLRHLVCRLLLEKKKILIHIHQYHIGCSARRCVCRPSLIG